MYIKITGITEEIMKGALSQAKIARLHILSEMAKVIQKPKKDVNENAPKILQMKISKDKIRDVIGSGGKVIRDIFHNSHQFQFRYISSRMNNIKITYE